MPVLAPRRSMIAFVAMVEPCLKLTTSSGRMPALSSAFITPSMNVGGVEGDLTANRSLVASS
jgi:hypothetical protein